MRDHDARRRVLESAGELVREMGPRAVTVDAIADVAGVGKQTIYRWWPSKSAVVMDALIELTDPAPADVSDTTYEAVRFQMCWVASMFVSRNGELIREVVAECQGDPRLAEDFRSRFFSHRRARGADTLVAGVANGELRPDLDINIALDVLYAPLWFRLLVGHGVTDQSAADQVLDLVWPGLTNTSIGPSKY